MNEQHVWQMLNGLGTSLQLTAASLVVGCLLALMMTMLGPSGSGKTTCLMMLAGFETATGGDIYIDGVPVNHLAPHKRDIGMVFQNYALFPHMTIAENLAFPLKVRKLDSDTIQSKVQSVLEMVEQDLISERECFVPLNHEQ